MTRYNLQPPNILPIDNQNTSTCRLTRPQSENNIINFNQPQVSPLAPHPQIHLPENQYHLQTDMEARPTENLTNHDKDCFDESLLTLLNS